MLSPETSSFLLAEMTWEHKARSTIKMVVPPMAGVQEGLLGSQIWNELAKELRATSRYRVRFRNAFAKLTRELRKFLNLPAGGTEKKKPL